MNIKGPLGEMSMEIPPFVSIEGTGQERTYSVSIADQEDKKQKAMWGKTRRSRLRCRV